MIMVVGLLAVLGLIFGSFVSALTWRLHEQAELADKKGKAAAKRRRELSMVKGRSMCPHCGHTLAAKDLAPVLSWMWLRGRCRYCRATIPDNPLVEILTGALFATSYASWPNGFRGLGLSEFVLWLMFLVGFMVLAVYDVRWYLLPDKVVFPLVALAAAEVVLTAIARHSLSALWMPAAGAAVISGFFWFLYQISDGNWIGGGDVKLGVVLGLLAGTPLRALLVIFLASLAGTVASLPLLVRGRAGLKRHIPFGPYLLFATVIVVVYGTQLTAWYEGLVLR